MPIRVQICASAKDQDHVPGKEKLTTSCAQSSSSLRIVDAIAGANGAARVGHGKVEWCRRHGSGMRLSCKLPRVARLQLISAPFSAKGDVLYKAKFSTCPLRQPDPASEAAFEVEVRTTCAMLQMLLRVN